MAPYISTKKKKTTFLLKNFLPKPHKYYGFLSQLDYNEVNLDCEGVGLASLQLKDTNADIQ